VLVMSGPAVSRSEMAPRDVDTSHDWVTQDDSDVPDGWEDGDGAVVQGDDDNWDKPHVDTHGPSSSELRGTDAWTGDPVDSKLEAEARVALSVFLRLLLLRW
jgi:hypothetical protein